MSTHQRHVAGCADRRTTVSRCCSAIVMSFILPLLAAACGSEQVADSAGTAPPVAAQSDPVVSETLETPEAFGTLADDDDADYTDAELEVLLDAPSADGDDVTDAPKPEPLEANSPGAAIEAIETELDQSPGAAVDATPILDKVQPLDDAPVTAFGIRDGRHINEAGEAIRLDEPAALACANVEIALTALDEGRYAEAADHLRTASTMAADTMVVAMNPWSSILEQTATEVATGATSNGTVSNDAMSTQLAFLGTCTQGGYEL